MLYDDRCYKCKNRKEYVDSELEQAKEFFLDNKCAWKFACGAMYSKEYLNRYGVEIIPSHDCSLTCMENYSFLFKGDDTMFILDFTNNLKAQDMIKLIGKKKNLSEKEAILLSVNKKNYEKILKTGYSSIALSLWGHSNPDREMEKIENPIIEVNFDEDSLNAIREVLAKEKVDMEKAISYFLLYEMESLGYHI